MKPVSTGFYWVLFLISCLATNLFLMAEEGKKEKVSELVPKDLKGWTIEIFEQCLREGSEKAILDSEGNLRVQYLRRSTMTEKKVSVPPEDVTTLFQATREFLNHYRMKDLPRTPELDVQWLATIRDEQGRAIQIEIDAYKVRKSPEVLRMVHLARKSFGKHGFGAHGFRYEFDPAENEPPGEQPTDRVPKKPGNWSFAVKTGAMKNVYPPPMDNGPSLWCADKDITISGPKGGKQIELNAEDEKLKDQIARQILNRFQLQNRSDQGSPHTKKFDICLFGDTDLTLTCDRQTLIDDDVLDELDAWVKGINHRFEDAGLKERFVPPWSE